MNVRAFIVAGLTGLVTAAVLLCAGPSHAQRGGAAAPVARLQLESREAYANMPFGLLVVAEGFDEDPAPAQPELTIPGATVTPLGVEPRVSQSIQIVNGRRFESRDVTWVFRWRVEAAAAGPLTVPAVTIVQGDKQAVAEGGALRVTDIATTPDMRIEVALPDRPVWVGETVPVAIDWLLRRPVHDQQLVVPLLSTPDDFTAAPAPRSGPDQKVLEVPVGATTMELPYDQDDVTVGGQRFTRFRFHVLVTPLRAGAIALEPARVVASLEVGKARDSFGFPTARTQLFRADDVARTLEVKPLPQQGRPASFAGAVGTSFSIAARTSRSVVQLGEPVDLEITVKGDTRLDGLSLGPLAGAGRLPADRFSMPDTAPPGELADDGKTKVFKVAVQVTDPTTTEIPPLELAWFDPVAGGYRTATSEPIALSVKGGAVVGAGDVIAGGRGSGAPAPASTGAASADVSLVGADLALSAPGAALARPLDGVALWALVLGLYLVPLGVLGWRTWRKRTAGRREERGEVARARRAVEAALEAARTRPARDAVGPLVAALRGLARAVGAPADDPVLARLETEGYAPAAAEAPLPEDARRAAGALARRWADERPRGGAGVGPAAALALLIVLVGGRVAHAAPDAAGAAAAPGLVDEGRLAYQQAMAAVQPGARQAAFARAAAAFAAAAQARPDSVELLTDWGNAALGAGDFGAATLAFRRALAIDGDHARASKNLAWLRGRLPDNLQPRAAGATSRLLFFRAAWTRTTKLVVGAAAFAIAMLLLVPWTRRGRHPAQVPLAVAALLACAMMNVSVVIDGGAGADGVVMQAQPLRSADAAGAPVASAAPLPAGAEVTILERRTGWTKVRTAGGQAGWLPEVAVAPVSSP